MDDLFDDIEPKKIVRATDPLSSKIAAQITPSGKSRTFIYDEVIKAGSRGVTLKEICSQNDLQMSSYSSRASELERLKLVHYQGDRRDGSRVMRSSKSEIKLCGKCSGVLLSFYEFKCHFPGCGG